MLPRRLRRLPVRARRPGLIVLEASRPLARLLGLALLREPPRGYALHLPRCRSVHTFGMRFPLDVTFLDAHGHTIRVEHGVGPNRVLLCRGARSVLELPAPNRGAGSPSGRATPSRPAARAAASAR